MYRLIAILFVLVTVTSSCIQDEVGPIVHFKNDAGDTITGDTLSGNLNDILSFIGDTRDDQDLGEVQYLLTLGDLVDEPIPYSDPIFLTNRQREVRFDIPLIDTLFESGQFGSFTISATDMEGNNTTDFLWVSIN